jgi:hypothetical protein
MNYLSVLVHFCVMTYGLSNWCGGSKIAMLYTAQYLTLHAFCWAIPDRRYTSYVIKHSHIFGLLAFVNIFGYFSLIAGGIYTYTHSKDGLAQLLGFSVASFQLAACTLMVVTVFKSWVVLRSKVQYAYKLSNN